MNKLKHSLLLLEHAQEIGYSEWAFQPESISLRLCVENRNPLPADATNLPFFPYADCVEFFLKDSQAPDYHELHCSTNGIRYQIHLPSREQLQVHRHAAALPAAWVAPTPEFVLTRNQLQDGFWELDLSIPWDLFPQGMPNRIQYHCAGYDAQAPGKPPRLWSSVPFSRRDFHYQEEWHQLQLRPQP